MIRDFLSAVFFVPVREVLALAVWVPALFLAVLAAVFFVLLVFVDFADFFRAVVLVALDTAFLFELVLALEDLAFALVCFFAVAAGSVDMARAVFIGSIFLERLFLTAVFFVVFLPAEAGDEALIGFQAESPCDVKFFDTVLPPLADVPPDPLAAMD